MVCYLDLISLKMNYTLVGPISNYAANYQNIANYCCDKEIKLLSGLDTRKNR